MQYLRKRGWEIPTRETTPEAIFLGRREFLAGAGALAATAGLSSPARSPTTPIPPPGSTPPGTTTPSRSTAR